MDPKLTKNGRQKVRKGVRGPKRDAGESQDPFTQNSPYPFSNLVGAKGPPLGAPRKLNGSQRCHFGAKGTKKHLENTIQNTLERNDSKYTSK